jgi:hypothetical protein
MKRKSQPIDGNDRLTPDQERDLAFSIVQGDAGLTYGPFGKKGLSLQTFLKRSKRTRSVRVQIPSVLFTYLKQEAERFGMTVEELMVTILETHQFKDRDRQMIMLAVDRASRGRAVAGLGRVAKRSLKEVKRRLEQEEQRPSSAALADFRDIVRLIREEAKRAGLDKLTMAEINAEVDATRKEMRAKGRKPVKRSIGQ